MQKKAIILLANGFEEAEALVPFDFLKRAGIDVKLVAVQDVADKAQVIDQGFIVSGSHGLQVLVKECLMCVKAEEFDAVIIPGGLRGANNISESKSATERILNQKNSNKTVAAICASPAVVLDKAGYFNTNSEVGVCYPNMDNGKPYLSGKNGTNGVCVSNNLITSRGPSCAEDFAFAIIEKLVGKEIANEVKDDTIYINKDR